MESRAEELVRGYLNAHAALLERATRLEEKVQRLERSGTPSESARNRAGRARGEVVSGLAGLRADFVEAIGERNGASTFDRAVASLCPAFASHRSPDAVP